MRALEQELEEANGRYSAALRELHSQGDLVGALERELERTDAAQKEATREVQYAPPTTKPPVMAFTRDVLNSVEAEAVECVVWLE